MHHFTEVYLSVFICFSGVFKHSQTLCRALLADITPPQERSQVFGTFNASSSIGFIVGPMLGGKKTLVNLKYIFIIYRTKTNSPVSSL